MRAQGKPIDATIERMKDGTIVAVTDAYWMGLAHREVTFWASKAVCDFAINLMVSSGKMLPPDIK
jgi:hypothetical protein